MSKFKEVHGHALLEADYSIVPIKKGEKDPRTKGWQNIQADEEQLKKWCRNSYYGGFGVLGKDTPGIDIDVKDEIVVQKIKEWVFENIGQSPVRIGNPPRILIPFAPPPGGLGPDCSPKFRDPNDDEHQIEIKAAGQQWVAYGIHPGTCNYYQWEGGELYDTYSELLPTLTGEKIDSLFSFFEKIMPTTWRQVSAGRQKQKTGGLGVTGDLENNAAFENYVPPLNLDDDKIVSMLALIDPDESEQTWRTVGMALYHQYEGSKQGKQIFIDWSQNSIDFDLNEINNRWPSWDQITYGGKPITCATVVSMYNEAHKKIGKVDSTLRLKSKKLAEWEARFVLVELPDGTEVHDVGVPVHRSPRRSLKAFKEHNAAYVYRSVSPEGDIRNIPMVDAWRSSKNTKHYAGYVYRPGADRFCRRPGAYRDDDSLYINTFYFPPHPEIEPGDRNNVFFSFLNHLFPVKEENQWFVKWMARLIQKPHTRSFVTPINITPVTGTGRGLLFEVIRLVVGTQNTHDVSPDDMEGRFNGFLDKCLVAVVQEIKAATGDRKYQAWERLKSLLTDTSSNIQQKGVDSYTAPVYANFLMFSNNIDALPIEDLYERRIYAMRGADKPITQENIDALKDWMSDELNIAALFYYLKTVPIKDSDFRRAPVSSTKVQMVQAAAGSDKQALHAWLEEKAPEVFTYAYLEESLFQFAEEFAGFDMSMKSVTRNLRDKGYHQKRIRIGRNGERNYVWYHPGKTDETAENLKSLVKDVK